MFAEAVQVGQGFCGGDHIGWEDALQRAGDAGELLVARGEVLVAVQFCEEELRWWAKVLIAQEVGVRVGEALRLHAFDGANRDAERGIGCVALAHGHHFADRLADGVLGARDRAAV